MTTYAERDDLIREAVREGLSQAEVARIWAITPARVNQIIRADRYRRAPALRPLKCSCGLPLEAAVDRCRVCRLEAEGQPIDDLELVMGWPPLELVSDRRLP